MRNCCDAWTCASRDDQRAQPPQGEIQHAHSACCALRPRANPCSGGGDSGPAGDQQPTAQATAEALNGADIEFLQMMIPHHRQATEMAEMVASNTERAELRQLADEIASTQSAEIEQMNGLLESAGESPDGMDMGGEMPGMMGDAAMSELEGLQGQAFDPVFVDMMTEHHVGAVEMAEGVLADGENAEVRALAEDIIAAQRAEIDQMEQWRQTWS